MSREPFPVTDDLDDAPDGRPGSARGPYRGERVMSDCTHGWKYDIGPKDPPGMVVPCPLCAQDAEVASLRAALASAERERDEANATLRYAVQNRLAETARAEAAERRAEAAESALVARHGGEPVALLSELDAARSALSEAREALRGLAVLRNDKGEVDAKGQPCWCDLPSMIPYRGHNGDCIAARRALASAPSGDESKGGSHG